LLAALATGKSVLQSVLFSDDSRVFMEALKTLGYEVDIDEEKKEVCIVGHGSHIPKENVSVYVGSAGTAARFLTAMLALSGGHYEVSSSEQMKARPMRPLLEALEQLGAVFEFQEKPYAFPFTIVGKREMPSGVCREIGLNIDASSQFLSALLLNSIFVEEGFLVRLTGTRDAKAYVKISMKMMAEFGCRMEQESENVYRLLPGQHYQARNYQIEPDVSAACYFYAMAAIHAGTAIVNHVRFDSTQGDIRFLKVLEQMGCSLEETESGICLTGPQQLHGLHVKMSDFSDQTMTLAVTAVFADRPTTITGVGHIRRQESNRIEATVTELNRLGVRCEEEKNGITIYPGSVSVKDVIHTYDDHRMAMAFALMGTKIPGIIIDNPSCCKKTFENYFDILTNLDLSLE
jgi:3-phosphoshikimate 1-carboxyvinyltransferase